MKSLAKIIHRYCLSAALIILFFFCVNFSAFLFFGYQSTEDEGKNMQIRYQMDVIGSSLAQDAGGIYLTQKGYETLGETEFIWAMALNSKGKVVWSWQLPKEIPTQYSLQDVAVFSRWYLKDYPVRVWSYGEYLMVFGNARNSIVKLNLVAWEKGILRLPIYAKIFISLNLVMIIFIVLLFGYRFYRSLKPLAEGIDRLSRQEAVNLKERGMISELAKKINHTSVILEKQSVKLKQRDEARTDWIAGVSHDIRTPLALIMGYSDSLAASPALGTEEKAQAEAICRQSVVIRQLIEDLNLTSKLAYHAQPLHMAEFSPALLLRECVAEFYNEGLEQGYEIDVLISESAEKIRMNGDAGLWKRALRNLLGNSIRHNPGGCVIDAVLEENAGKCSYYIRDYGKGIPGEVVEILSCEDENPLECKIHIMGLRLVKQIARAHEGDLIFRKREEGNFDAALILGYTKEEK